MNNRQNGRRRGRGGQQARNGQPGGPDRGNRLDNRARGNAAQLLEKYKNLARDAQMQGDRVNTEYYLQFADHYFRVLNENRARFEEQRPRQQSDDREDFGGDEDGGDNRQQRYQAEGEQAEEGWEDGEQSQTDDRQPRQYEERQPRRERQAYRNDEEGEREPRAERPERTERAPREGAREGGRERGRRNGNANANGNGNGYANGNGNDFAAPAFLSEPLAPRFEFQGDSDEAPAAEAAPSAEEAAPKPRRPRAPRRPRGEGTAEA